LAAGRGVEAAEICHSGIRRARETAQRLADYLKPTRGVREIAGLLPEDDPEIAKAALALLDEPIMWVGHLPYMSRLAGLLVGNGGESPAIEFLPATMLCMSKIGARWRIEWRLVPKLDSI
jgi:phosphohistidine phosphatase